MQASRPLPPLLHPCTESDNRQFQTGTEGQTSICLSLLFVQRAVIAPMIFNSVSGFKFYFGFYLKNRIEDDKDKFIIFITKASYT